MAWRQRNTGATWYLPRMLFFGILAFALGPGGAIGRPALNLKLELGLNHWGGEPHEMPSPSRQAEGSMAVDHRGHPDRPVELDFRPTGITTPGATTPGVIPSARPRDPIDPTPHYQPGPSHFGGGGGGYKGKQVGAAEQQKKPKQRPYYRFLPDSLVEEASGLEERQTTLKTAVPCLSEESVDSPGLFLGLSVDSHDEQKGPHESLPPKQTHATELRGGHGFSTAESTRKPEPFEALAYWTSHQPLGFTSGVLFPASSLPLAPSYPHPHYFQVPATTNPFRPDAGGGQLSAQWQITHTQPYSVARLLGHPSHLRTIQHGRAHWQAPEYQRNQMDSLVDSGVTLKEWLAFDVQQEQAHLRRADPPSPPRRTELRGKADQTGRAGSNREHGLSTRASVGFKNHAHQGSPFVYGLHQAEASHMKNMLGESIADRGAQRSRFGQHKSLGLEREIDAARTRYLRHENAYQEGGNAYHWSSHWPGSGAEDINEGFNYRKHQG